MKEIVFQISHTASEADDRLKSVIYECLGNANVLCTAVIIGYVAVLFLLSVPDLCVDLARPV